VFDNGKTVLAHRPGEVLLVDVWATWCPPCQQPMAHNQEMLETNPHWNGKVRIVGVSVDDDK
jgi:thiol-disulfide isomerase/thioredoxin